MDDPCLQAKEWKDFWTCFPAKFSDTDFLRQVGKTHRGKPIDNAQMNLLLTHLCNNVRPDKNDVILDVCCGNGLLTSLMSNTCRHIVGVDFSPSLISVARKYNDAVNISYHRNDAMMIDENVLFESEPFNKVYMYEALQHFDEDQFSGLLSAITNLSIRPVHMYLASILDKERIDKFYNTDELKAQYEREKGERLLLGTWWDKEYMCDICTVHNLTCKFIDQPDELYTAHYRFDVLIKSK